tara:strand:- start:219 stop:335 length:117 start_codon:yes stop_codon:yes gene_type:complete
MVNPCSQKTLQGFWKIAAVLPQIARLEQWNGKAVAEIR